MKKIENNSYYGFHKPIMIAGGIGTIDNSNFEKKFIKDSDLIIVLGGPSMLVGLGGEQRHPNIRLMKMRA